MTDISKNGKKKTHVGLLEFSGAAQGTAETTNNQEENWSWPRSHRVEEET